jgi:hypothetical protein
MTTYEAARWHGLPEATPTDETKAFVQMYIDWIIEELPDMKLGLAMLRDVQNWVPETSLLCFTENWKERAETNATRVTAGDRQWEMYHQVEARIRDMAEEERQQQLIDDADRLTFGAEPEDRDWINDFLHVLPEDDRQRCWDELQRALEEQPLSEDQAVLFTEFTENVNQGGRFKEYLQGAPGTGKS